MAQASPRFSALSVGGIAARPSPATRAATNREILLIASSSYRSDPDRGPAVLRCPGPPVAPAGPVTPVSSLIYFDHPRHENRPYAAFVNAGGADLAGLAGSPVVPGRQVLRAGRRDVPQRTPGATAESRDIPLPPACRGRRVPIPSLSRRLTPPGAARAWPGPACGRARSCRRRRNDRCRRRRSRR